MLPSVAARRPGAIGVHGTPVVLTSIVAPVRSAGWRRLCLGPRRRGVPSVALVPGRSGPSAVEPQRCRVAVHSVLLGPSRSFLRQRRSAPGDAVDGSLRTRDTPYPLQRHSLRSVSGLLGCTGPACAGGVTDGDGRTFLLFHVAPGHRPALAKASPGRFAAESAGSGRGRNGSVRSYGRPVS